LRGKNRREDWETENGFQKDSNGSAKVALLAIERSMGAWTKLYNILISEEDAILKHFAPRPVKGNNYKRISGSNAI
jgi:hypothetical protein